MQKNSWQIKCKHTAETLDRVVMPFRKRGIAVDAFSYSKVSEEDALCTVEFVLEDELQLVRIYKNLVKTYDVNEVITG